MLNAPFTANARGLGSRQADALQNIGGSFALRTLSDTTPITGQGQSGAFSVSAATGAADARTSASLVAGVDPARTTTIYFTASQKFHVVSCCREKPIDSTPKGISLFLRLIFDGDQLAIFLFINSYRLP